MTPLAVLTEAQLAELLERAAERGAERALARGGSTPDVMDTAAAARVAGVGAKTLRAWVAEGRLRATKRGRALQITREDLSRAMAGDSPDPREAAAQALRSIPPRR